MLSRFLALRVAGVVSLLALGVFPACGDNTTTPRRNARGAAGKGGVSESDAGAGGSSGSVGKATGGPGGTQDGADAEPSRDSGGDRLEPDAGFDGGQKDAGADTPSPEAGVTPVSTATTLIGPAGGELVLGGVRLLVPPDALDVPRVLTVTARAARTNAVPSEDVIAGQVYDFEPDGLSFASPALLTIEHTNGDQGLSDGDIVIVTSAPGDSSWTELDSWQTGGGLAATVGHFTDFGTAVVKTLPARVRKCKDVSCPGCQECDPSTGFCQPMESSTPISACGTNKCFHLNHDKENCGACETPCGAGQICEEGLCVCACPKADGTCDIIDPDALEPVCPPGQIAAPGRCNRCVCKNPRDATCVGWTGVVNWTVGGSQKMSNPISNGVDAWTNSGQGQGNATLKTSVSGNSVTMPSWSYSYHASAGSSTIMTTPYTAPDGRSCTIEGTQNHSQSAVTRSVELALPAPKVETIGSDLRVTFYTPVVHLTSTDQLTQISEDSCYPANNSTSMNSRTTYENTVVDEIVLQGPTSRSRTGFSGKTTIHAFSGTRVDPPRDYDVQWSFTR